MRLRLHSMEVRNYRIACDDIACGAAIFSTTQDDPFFTCCVWHDMAYEKLGCESSKEIDRIFYQCIKSIAGNDRPLRFRAWLYYRACRAYGVMRRVVCKLRRMR